MIAPIFPLTDVVLFPKTCLPLHVFEARDRAMTREAMAGDRTIVMALLCDGVELNGHGDPAVHQVACLGRIDSCKELAGGKYDIVLTGLHRVRLVREIRHAPYRLAQVQRMSEARYSDRSEEVVRRRERLVDLYARYRALVVPGRSRVVDFVPRRNFEALVNRVAASLLLPPEDKQLLLEIDDIAERCDQVLQTLEQHVETLMLVNRYGHLKPRDPGRN